ncbi:MAG: hypothetical protein HYX57_08580 [Chloroflexi bacterium]|nr:hypothetical protein [Chloroflexota bacterium]
MIDNVRRIGLTAAWVLAILVLAFGGAGIVAQWSHPPGTAARAELTWHGDQALEPSLVQAQADLVAVAADVDRLSVLARGALAAVTSDDQAPFKAALDDGAGVARAIRDASAELRADLDALPGDSPGDGIAYSGDVIGRRAAMLAALEATEGLGRSWALLTAGSLAASDVIGLLSRHDITVAAAAAEGRAQNYEGAIAILAQATGMLDRATEIRDQLANTADVSTLDDWIGRNRRYDEALATLYRALWDANGLVTPAVRDAYAEEGRARALLPPDTRALVVIVADIGRGGLNQAVIAIEQARGRLNLALEALAPAADQAGAG